MKRAHAARIAVTFREATLLVSLIGDRDDARGLASKLAKAMERIEAKRATLARLKGGSE